MKRIQLTVVIVLLTGISLFFNHLKAQQMSTSNSELNSKKKKHHHHFILHSTRKTD